MVQISRSKAYRAKRRALDLVEGSHKEQYAALWDYCNELKRSNPGSTIMILYKPAFLTMYSCIKVGITLNTTNATNKFILYKHAIPNYVLLHKTQHTHTSNTLYMHLSTNNYINDKPTNLYLHINQVVSIQHMQQLNYSIHTLEDRFK